ncbi:MAG: hypothetical protein J5822_03540 [Eubacteriaceae bacterium]|nr:hypothetical protein [Eubacteriaceae bacterium]
MLYADLERIMIEEYRQFLSACGLLGREAMNEMAEKDPKGLVDLCEKRQQRKIELIASKTAESGRSLVLISGPSSSGKTTFAHRLERELAMRGKRIITVNMDDYYLDEKDMPLNMDGGPDFEAFESLDYRRLSSDLEGILRGEEVSLPGFDFVNRVRIGSSRTVRRQEDEIVLVEGIHALNPALAPNARDDAMKIFISAISSYSLNGINSSNTRLLRRLIRDYYHRGADYVRTLEMWIEVEMGSRRNIYPYAGDCDMWFNSSCAYEYCLYGEHLDRILPEKTRGVAYRQGIRRIREIINGYARMSARYVPDASVLNEFIKQ